MTDDYGILSNPVDFTKLLAPASRKKWDIDSGGNWLDRGPDSTFAEESGDAAAGGDDLVAQVAILGG